MITKDMIILNIVEDYPKTEEVFRSYDKIAGKCTMCHNLFDSLIGNYSGLIYYIVSNIVKGQIRF